MKLPAAGWVRALQLQPWPRNSLTRCWVLKSRCIVLGTHLPESETGPSRLPLGDDTLLLSLLLLELPWARFPAQGSCCRGPPGSTGAPTWMGTRQGLSCGSLHLGCSFSQCLTCPACVVQLCCRLPAGSLTPSENVFQDLTHETAGCLFHSCGTGCVAGRGGRPDLHARGDVLDTAYAPALPAPGRRCRGCCWQRRQLGAGAGSSCWLSCRCMAGCRCLPGERQQDFLMVCPLRHHSGVGHCPPECPSAWLQEKPRRKSE